MTNTEPTAHPTNHAEVQTKDGKTTAVCYGGMGAAMVEFRLVDKSSRITRWYCPWCNHLVATVTV